MRDERCKIHDKACMVFTWKVEGFYYLFFGNNKENVISSMFKVKEVERLGSGESLGMRYDLRCKMWNLQFTVDEKLKRIW